MASMMPIFFWLVISAEVVRFGTFLSETLVSSFEIKFILNQSNK